MLICSKLYCLLTIAFALNRYTPFLIQVNQALAPLRVENDRGAMAQRSMCSTTIKLTPYLIVLLVPLLLVLCANG